MPVIGDDAAYVIHRGHHRDHTARLLAGVFHKGTTVGIATFVDDMHISIYLLILYVLRCCILRCTYAFVYCYAHPHVLH